MTTNRIKDSYEAGVKSALDKLAFEGFGKMLKGNVNRAAGNKAQIKKNTSIGSSVANLFGSKKPAANPTPTAQPTVQPGSGLQYGTSTAYTATPSR